MSGTEAAKAYLKAYRARADARLEAVLREREGRLAALPFGTAAYHAHLTEYALRGGKRIRGALVELGHAAAGGEPAAALDASLSFELLHAYFLAFDDVMDRDELRRGGKALHVLAREEAARKGVGEAEHRGLSVALLLGLLAQAVSYDLLARGPFTDDVKGRALRWFNDVVEGVTVGQLLDVCAADSADVTLTQIGEIHRRKTGLYTTEGPLVLGAILAGAPAEGPIVAALRAWAVPVGEAFQHVDDVLGAVGDPEETGKQAASDLREGKRSAVVEEAIRRTEGAARARLERLVGRPLDASEAEEARTLIVESGAPTAVVAKAQRLVEEGERALAGVPDAQRAVLASLGRLVVARRS